MNKAVILLALGFSLPFISSAQKEKTENAQIKKVTVFTSGAQIEHEKSVSLSGGKQIIVFEKITEFIDPNSVQLKCSENATILSVRVRKNYDETSVKEVDLSKMNSTRKELELKEQRLRDEYRVLLRDEQLLQLNNHFGSNVQGVKLADLKEAATYFHTRYSEIALKKSQLELDIEETVRKINVIDQEINVRSSIPVKTYSEISVELSVENPGETSFKFVYITPNASWKPYYDMRSAGIGSPVSLEAKGLVTQNTGADWNNVQLVLSTNDPYDNTQEPLINPWYLNYYTPLPVRSNVQRNTTYAYTYSGETVHGEVLDAATGEPLAFAKISMSRDARNIVTTDASGHFSFTVPRNETGYYVNYVGYDQQFITINSPYTRIAMNPQDIAMEVLPEPQINVNTAGAANYSMDYEAYDAISLNEVTTVSASRKAERQAKKNNRVYANSQPVTGSTYTYTPVAQQISKDLRMEFVINTPFNIPSDNADHRVPIAVYQMNASYEYHSVPKFDPGVFLVAEVSGWEKLNLLNGESNIYFDGTFIGKSYVDVTSTKDTLSFSLGKDKKVIIERKRSEEMSKTRLVGSRYKYEITWDYTIRNNGGGAIPIIIKDQFPISTNEDIKVKYGSYEGASLNEDSKILTWRYQLNKGESKTFKFDYSVDYGKGQVIYLE